MSSILRNRTQDDIEFVKSYYLVPPGERFPTGGYVLANENFVSGSFYDHIEDTVETEYKKKRRAKQRIPAHPVIHVKARMNCPMFMFDYIHTSTTDKMVMDRYPVGMDINKIFELCPGPSSGTLSSFADIAFNKLYVQIPTNTSIANFLYEFKDWKSLIPSFKRNLKSGVTGNILNVEFGWKPLIGDVKKLLNLQQDVAKRLKFLRDTLGVRTRISVSGDIEPYGPASVQTGDFPHIQLKYAKDSYKGTWLCQGYLTQNLQGLDDAYTEMKAFSAALGLNSPARIVWNAIPYSFVVDWVTRFGSLLDRLSVPLFSGGWTVEDVTFSYNEICRFNVYQSEYASSSAPLTKLLGQATIERYVRNIGLPASSLNLIDSGLDIRKQLLALALIHVRM
jgi:hypothetical protein